MYSLSQFSNNLTKFQNIVRLEDIESQIIDFVKAHRYLTETSGLVSGLAMLTFSAGILINISAQIGLRTLPKNSSAIDIVLLSLWIAVSISFFIYSMLRPAEFFNCVRKLISLYMPGCLGFTFR